MAYWQSIFVKDLEAPRAEEQLKEALTARGWRLYDPFARLGSAYPQRVGCFLAPAQGGWLRILIESDLPLARLLAQALSAAGMGLLARLEEGVLTLHAYDKHNAIIDLATQLPETSARASMAQALAGDPPPLPPLSASPQIAGISLEDAPDALRRMSANAPAQQVSRLFDRIARSLLSREQEASARSLLRQAEGPDWQSPGGLTLRHVLAALQVPAGWHAPDFAALRLAYPLHLRRQRQPRAPLLPGDAEALAAVPNALEYRPVYAGKDAAS